MSSHPEKEKSASVDSKHTSDRRGEEEVAEPAKVSPLKQKLTLVGHYAMLGLAPVLSVCALVIAVVAVTGNQSGEEQLSKAIAKTESLNAGLAATKSELDKLKLSIAQDKAQQEEERKKHEDQFTRIIQNITPLQVKLKISPTLEDQLRQAVSGTSVAPAGPSSVQAANPSVPAASPAPTAAANKSSLPQVKAMKDAIEKYNKIN